MLNIHTIPCLNDNYSYVIHDEISNLVGVIDPSEFSSIDNFISKKLNKIDYIFNTHHHFDHVGGNKELKKKYSTKILGSKTDRKRIPEIDFLLSDGDNFKFGKINFNILFIPGHTSGHIAFYSKQEKIVFTGDVLFSLGCGRIFEGTYSQMFKSINKLKNLPKETNIFCGHEYTKKNLDFCLKYESENKFLLKKQDWINDKIKKGLPTVPVKLEDELNTNIFLRCDNKALKNKLKMNNSEDELIFEKLRNLRDEF
ncbi:hydroxyacylglutathione hydrolase [Pelagibacteraceae bacterium]|jgi:hydroxyacylglutathione hydrolase|nr:hydroxyacylglutathione hydrolase [Pelagibacteraceae bacterium]|tara:strand:- start:11 stop:775 length:765 start_codon:yes stop_codon:yes gene_type:complete